MQQPQLYVIQHVFAQVSEAAAQCSAKRAGCYSFDGNGQDGRCHSQDGGKQTHMTVGAQVAEVNLRDLKSMYLCTSMYQYVYVTICSSIYVTVCSMYHFHYM